MLEIDSSELASGSSAGRECLGHDGTLKLLASWREILGERQVRDEDEMNNNTITVSVGPQYEGDMSESEIIGSYFMSFTFIVRPDC